MSPTVELNLTLLLFLPWFLILGVLFWWFPRTPRNAARVLFDIAALLLALAAFLASVRWSFDNADPGFGKMWQQILATALGYAVFLGVIAVAFVLRWRWLKRRG